MMIQSRGDASQRTPDHPRTQHEKPSVTLLGLHGPFANDDRSWVDALDPSLPSDPPLGRCQPAYAPTPHAHKFILGSATLGASALLVGYLAASWLL